MKLPGVRSGLALAFVAAMAALTFAPVLSQAQVMFTGYLEGLPAVQ